MGTKIMTAPIDNINLAVLNKIIVRANQGMEKYGVSMERKDVSEVQWLQHAQEEALDLAIYLERIIQDRKAQLELEV